MACSSRAKRRRTEAVHALLYRLAKEHDAELELVDDVKDRSWNAVTHPPNRIKIAKQPPRKLCIMVCSMIHELSHVHCHRNSLWSAYHVHGDEDQAWRAERWVARHAERRYKQLGLEKRFGKYYDPYIHNPDKDKIKRLLHTPDIGEP